MNVTAMQFVEILASIEKVDASSLLSPDQKNKIFKDMHFALPADFYCTTCVSTREIVEGILTDRLAEAKKQQEIQLGIEKAARKSSKKNSSSASPSSGKGK
jgi:hypothetical protein